MRYGDHEAVEDDQRLAAFKRMAIFTPVVREHLGALVVGLADRVSRHGRRYAESSDTLHFLAKVCRLAALDRTFSRLKEECAVSAR
jgi:hypothetical protein